MSLEVDVVRELPDAVVVARGEIDLASVPALQEVLEGLGDGTSVVVVDLSEVSFLDSSGLRVLAQCQRRLSRATGPIPLRLVVAGRAVERVFDVTGLRSFFEVYDTRDAAIRGR